MQSITSPGGVYGAANMFGAIDSANAVYRATYSTGFATIVKIVNGAITAYRNITVTATSTQFVFTDMVYESTTNSIYASIVENTPAGGIVSYIFKLDTSLNVTWQRKLAGATTANSLSINGLAVDTSGNVYMCGSLFNSGFLGFIAKYDSTGTTLTQRLSGFTSTLANNNIVYSSLVLDGAGNIFACGTGYQSGFGTNSSVPVVIKYNTSLVASGTSAYVPVSLIAYPARLLSASLVQGSGLLINFQYYEGTLIGYHYVMRLSLTTLAIVWQRRIGKTSYTVLPAYKGIAVSSQTPTYYTAGGRDESTGYPYLAKFPLDATGTGSATIGAETWTYSAGLASINTGWAAYEVIGTAVGSTPALVTSTTALNTIGAQTTASYSLFKFA